MAIFDKLTEIAGKVAKVIRMPVDKLEHAIAGALIGVVGMLLTGSKQVVPVLIIVLIVGIGKEVYDHIANLKAGKKVHDVDVYDTIATVLGGALAVGLMAIFNSLS